MALIKAFLTFSTEFSTVHREKICEKPEFSTVSTQKPVENPVLQTVKCLFLTNSKFIQIISFLSKPAKPIVNHENRHIKNVLI